MEALGTVHIKRVRNLEELKKLSAVDGGADFYILLNFGLRSSKHIQYDHDEATFFVDNLIDGTEEELTEAQLRKKTNIVKAIEMGSFFYEGYA